MARSFAGVRRGLFVLLVVFAMVGSIAGSAFALSVHDLGRIDFDTWASDVNDRGVVVGSGYFNSPELSCCDWVGTAAFTYADGKRSVLSPQAMADGNSRWAAAVNNTGKAVGGGFDKDGNRQGVHQARLWSRSGTERNLGRRFGPGASDASDINDAGHVVGHYTFGASAPRAFLWTGSGAPRNLGTLSGDEESRATALNERGQVVGYSGSYSRARAFVWTAEDGMRDLGTLGGNASRAVDINDRGEVVGVSTTAKGVNQAFVWTAEDGMQALPIERSYWVGGINDSGQISGARYVPGTGPDYTGARVEPWRYSAADGVEFLPIIYAPYKPRYRNEVNATGAFAKGINAKGHVVGQSSGANGLGYAGSALLWK